MGMGVSRLSWRVTLLPVSLNPCVLAPFSAPGLSQPVAAVNHSFLFRVY